MEPDWQRIASYSRALFSDDHGRTWRLGAPVDYAMSSECQVIERNDSSLLLNFRIRRSGLLYECGEEFRYERIRLSRFAFDPTPR